MRWRTGKSQPVDSLDDATDVFVDVELPDPLAAGHGGRRSRGGRVDVHGRMRSAIANGASSTLGVCSGSDERFPHVERARARVARQSTERAIAIEPLHRHRDADPRPQARRSRSRGCTPEAGRFTLALSVAERTHEKRKKRLIERGVTEEELDAAATRPSGYLDWLAHSPEEIALSVMATNRCRSRNGASP